MVGSAAPLYAIHRYRDDIYKIVAFKGSRDLDKVYVRDRAGKLMQFIRDKRKKYNSKIQVLLVPERHKDGAWHIHGLVSFLPVHVLAGFTSPAPSKLIEGGFLNWPDYMSCFGFCSLAPIRDPVATAFYITKYVSKDLSRRAGDKGKHLYFHSRPLQHAEKASDVYLYNNALDAYCTEDHDFCRTGMVEDAPWYFPYVWEGAEVLETPLEPRPMVDPLQSFRPWEIDPFYEQMRISIV